MKINSRLISAFLFLILGVFELNAQEKKYEFYGNIRLAHIGADSEPDGIGGDNTLLRFRPGIRYMFSENHSFSGRLVYLISKDFEPVKFTVKADGNQALAYGSVSFDEFYYQYKKDNFILKAGRFQKSISVLSNAKRSHLRFQSNAVYLHWSDGFYLKKGLDKDWFGEAIIEYQNSNALSFPYSGGLDFQNNEHNLNYYFGVENQTRDANNIIQKGFGILIAPNAYLKPDGYSTYAAIASRIVFDLPAKKVLKGGSIRIAGELGQNLNAELPVGTSAVTSVGINNFAERHEFMIEFASTDQQWLTSTSYSANSDEIEFRYRFFYDSNLNFDVRYRIREPRSNFLQTQYSTFFRVTYSF